MNLFAVRNGELCFIQPVEQRKRDTGPAKETNEQGAARLKRGGDIRLTGMCRV